MILCKKTWTQFQWQYDENENKNNRILVCEQSNKRGGLSMKTKNVCQ